MTRLAAIAVALASVAAADEPAHISAGTKHPEGWVAHEVRSAFQAGPTELRVLVPADPKAGEKFPAVYLLPVEAGRESRYGDGLAEIKKLDLHNRLRAVFVAPTFSQLPWYADHPTKADVRQETYFRKVVVPFVEETYPVRAGADGRLLLGFSKSGWGAFSLLLRHPDEFGKAAAWDAPLMMDAPGKYGSGDVFGTPENFQEYQVTRLLNARAHRLRGGRRLILLGYGSFRADHKKAHELMDDLLISHEYQDGPARKHDWHSGWVAEAADRLIGRLDQEPNTWVKRSPLPGGPPSPGLAYEAALAYDPFTKRVIRWAGHNQGGGGEQNAETWAYDPLTSRWELREPNTSPPGACCNQQHVFDPVGRRYIRFPAFSGSHGWHWFRENYLSNSAVWTYSPLTNTWRDMRPVPAPRVSPLRCASWDSDSQVAVVFGGEGNHEGTVVYDPYTNAWTRMRPAKEPPERSGGNLAYDPARKLHILFGTQFGEDPHTWGYDLRKNEWRDLKPATQPPTDRNDPVLAYDPNGRVVVAVVRVIDKAEKDEVLQGHLETWAYDAGANTWTRMKPPREPDGFANRRRILVAVPDRNLLLMEAYVNPMEKVPGVEREQQIWTYRYAAPKPDDRPAPPAEVSVTTTAGAAKVKWKPVPGAERYAIYRGSGALPWQAEFKPVAYFNAKDPQAFDDTELKAGTVYHYFIRSIDAKGQESADSMRVRTQPRVVEDAVVYVMGPKEVRLMWSKPAGGDVAGYHVERAAVEVFSEDELVRLKTDTPPLAEPSVGGIKAIGPFRRLTKGPIEGNRFTDTDLDLTKPVAADGEPTFTHRFAKEQIDPAGKPYRFAVYAYRIRAVNAQGVEGGAGPYRLTIPGSVKRLFAREDGEKCHLKWDPNPEAVYPKSGMKGYRVYRMEGPKINGPGQKVTRLTAEPITATTFTDEQAGKDTRRFWVVAVDALGQEGVPSAPAWHWRQYRKDYLPFTGEWHQ